MEQFWLRVSHEVGLSCWLEVQSHLQAGGATSSPTHMAGGRFHLLAGS